MKPNDVATLHKYRHGDFQSLENAVMDFMQDVKAICPDVKFVCLPSGGSDVLPKYGYLGASKTETLERQG